MKKLSTIFTALCVTIVLTACGNDASQSNRQQDQASTSSQVKTSQTKSSQRSAQSSTNQTNNSPNNATTNSSSAKQVMTASQVIARVAQLKNVNLNGGDKIFVTPTSTPNVFKIYIKGANQDPEVDSIIDHYVYNGNTDVLSQATDR